MNHKIIFIMLFTCMCHMIFPQLTVQCQPKNDTPCEIQRGSATSDQQFAYFTPHDSTLLYSYEWNTELWRQLPQNNYENALVIVNGELTAVGGGRSKYDCINKLYTLRQRKWVVEYPPMKTARSKPAAVITSDGDYILVVGGLMCYGWTNTVELFQVKTRQWYGLTNLTQSLPNPSATICGNQVHVIGSDSVIGYSCSLQALPSSDEPITSESIPDLISWAFLPRLPVTDPTIATLSGQLIIIGGEQGGSPVNSIHQLVKGQWVKISSMASGRMKCLSVSPSPDRVMIVGGLKGAGKREPIICYSVEEFVVKE